MGTMLGFGDSNVGGDEFNACTNTCVYATQLIWVIYERSKSKEASHRIWQTHDRALACMAFSCVNLGNT